MNNASAKIRPFLKWPGGKYHLIDKIRQNLPLGNRLIEPFVGAGSVFLNTNYANYLLADINQDLINCFNYLQQEKQSFIDFCYQFFKQEYNTKKSYLSLRMEFNITNDKRLKAALFLYLNRHCYNGLVRYNNDGLFNSPFGAYKKPYFPSNEMLDFANKALLANVICANYIDTMNHAVVGDVIYCDPPYMPLSITANFTKYHKTNFNQTEQENLVLIAKELAKKGISVMISNHNTKVIQNLYIGATIINFDVRRKISCLGNQRNKVSELLAFFGSDLC